MLTQPTLDKLQTLRLAGMYQALVEQLQMPDIAALTCEERLSASLGIGQGPHGPPRHVPMGAGAS